MMPHSLNLSRCINIPDDFEGYNKEVFCIPRHYADSVKSVLVPQGMIMDRIERLANDIFTKVVSSGQEPISTLCVLKGGYKFFSDLQDKLNMLNSHHSEGSVQISVDFIRLKSYENTASKSEVQIIGIENLESLRGKNVLVVAHGTTSRALVKYLEDVTDDDIMEINIPNGIPFSYELNGEMKAAGEREYYAPSHVVKEAEEKAASIGSK